MTIYGYIYKITNLVNGKVYIGQTTSNPPLTRWYGHKNEAKSGRKPSRLYNSMRCHGVESFKFEVLFFCDSKFQLDCAEKAIIKAYDSTSRRIGYNLATGGDSGGKHAEESKVKNSLAHKGKPTWNKGIPRTDAEKKLMSENRKGIKSGTQSEEWIAKRTACHKGKVVSQETREKLSNISKQWWINKKKQGGSV
jgi:group I intron endonuclease